MATILQRAASFNGVAVLTFEADPRPTCPEWAGAAPRGVKEKWQCSHLRLTHGPLALNGQVRLPEGQKREVAVLTFEADPRPA